MTPESLSAVANHVWQSTLFAGIVALLALALRKNGAAVRHRLWMAASIKFLIPFSLLVGAGSHYQWRSISTVAEPTIVQAVGGITRPFAFENSKPVASQPSHPSNGLTIALIGLWLSGAAAVAFSWLREWRRLRKVVKTAAVAPLTLPIRALESRDRIEPGVVGIFRPVLLLPEGITERLPGGPVRSHRHPRVVPRSAPRQPRRRDSLDGRDRVLVPSAGLVVGAPVDGGTGTGVR